MDQDIASSTYVAESVAKRLYPNVAVAVPMAVGISEHHMKTVLSSRVPSPSGISASLPRR